jgi:hypothetical protein
MWYDKYNNYADDDLGDNVSIKEKHLTLSDLQKIIKNQQLKDELQQHFDIMLNNSGDK